jgi:hypothetical protein
MIPRGLEPIDWAASMMPPSTSARALSTCLEKKGTVPKTRGSIAPLGGTISILSGAREKAEAALDYLRGKNVHVEVLADGRTAG